MLDVLQGQDRVDAVDRAPQQLVGQVVRRPVAGSLHTLLTTRPSLHSTSILIPNPALTLEMQMRDHFLIGRCLSDPPLGQIGPAHRAIH